MIDNRYPARESDVVALGDRHFARYEKDSPGLLWWHDCTVSAPSWCWVPTQPDGHAVLRTRPLSVAGDFRCPRGCGDRGNISEGHWLKA